VTALVPRVARPTTDVDVFGALEASGEQWQFTSRAGSHQYLRLYDLTRRYIPGGAEVLDWGTGSGHFAYFLIRSGFRTTGFSLFDDPVPAVLADSGYRFVMGDAADPVTLPFEDESFDVVASIGVLEHVRETGGDEEASLREIRRVLRPGGTFLCYHLPNRYSWIDLAARTIKAGHHTYRYTPDEIVSLVGGAGLRLLEQRRYAFLPRLPLHRLPRRLRWSEPFAHAYDAVDAALGRACPWICQNHYFVARRDDAHQPNDPNDHRLPSGDGGPHSDGR
jgi:SAM-dependent methyltransferase